MSPAVAKAKIRIQLPPTLFTTYLEVCVVSQAFSTPCTRHVGALPALPDGLVWEAAYADNWVVTPDKNGGPPSYGVFAPVHISMLAFGSIPVTATLYLSQTVHNGLYDPFELQLTAAGSALPPGFVIPGYGPTPSYPDDNAQFSYPASITGTVNLRIADVAVDGQPLDVGNQCRSVTPAALTLSAVGGFYDINDILRPGKPGEFAPLGQSGPGGTLSGGNVDIPAFTGCSDGNEDLSTLITGMASGPTNSISAYADTVLNSFCSYVAAHCTTAQAAVQDSALALNAAAKKGDIAAVRKIASTMSPTAPGPTVAAPK